MSYDMKCTKCKKIMTREEFKNGNFIENTGKLAGQWGSEYRHKECPTDKPLPQPPKEDV